MFCLNLQKIVDNTRKGQDSSTNDPNQSANPSIYQTKTVPKKASRLFIFTSIINCFVSQVVLQKSLFRDKFVFLPNLHHTKRLNKLILLIKISLKPIQPTQVLP